MSKYTEGPWYGLRDGRYNLARYHWNVSSDKFNSTECAPITLENGVVIALVVKASNRYYSGSHPAVEERARLIAAAPLMLDALQAVKLDAVSIGGAENAISDATRTKVIAAIQSATHADRDAEPQS